MFEFDLINTDPNTGARRGCLHTPHGAHSPVCMPFFPPTMAIARKALFPSDTALKKAVRSAQLAGVKDAFSILHPP